MNLKKQIIVLAILLVVMRASRTYASYDTAESYLQYCNFTQDQTKYVLEKSNGVRNKDHYIKWIGAIAAHEMGGTFIDGQTKFFAGRLHPAMKYKDFKTQVDGRTTAYNKYWYNLLEPEDWIKRSKYCVTENDGTPGCPNWLVNTKAITAMYKPSNTVLDEHREPLRRVVADKVPVGTSKRCKIIHTTQANGYIQADYMGRFINRIRGLKKGSKIFFCWDAK